MIAFALGLGALALLAWSAGAFSRAKVANLKALLGWVAGLAILTLGAGLLLSGRGAAAIMAALLLAPLAVSWWQEGKLDARRPRPGAQRSPGRPPTRGRMTRAEALQVLGLRDPASEADIRAAWVRLMRAAHPDAGGSDWLAARVNEARDVLLREG